MRKVGKIITMLFIVMIIVFNIQSVYAIGNNKNAEIKLIQQVAEKDEEEDEGRFISR